MSSRARLLQLEQTGQYVFHGSPFGGITSLEPRQATHVPELSKPDDKMLDGRPGVSASRYADFAIFHAIVNTTNINGNHVSGFGVEHGRKVFYVSDNVLKSVKDKRGFVYVLNKKDFEPYERDGDADEDAMEWRSHASVRPMEVIEVCFDDLPEEGAIEITSHPSAQYG